MMPSTSRASGPKKCNSILCECGRQKRPFQAAGSVQFYCEKCDKAKIDELKQFDQ